MTSSYYSDIGLEVEKKSARSHLSVYASLYSSLTGFEEGRTRGSTNKASFLSELKAKPANNRPSAGSNVNRIRPSIAVSDNLANLIYDLLVYKLKIRDRGDEEVLRTKREDKTLVFNGQVAVKGPTRYKVKKFIEIEIDDLDNLERVERILKTESDAEDMLRKFQEGISELILRIGAGEPLEGRCDTCPGKIHVARRNSDESTGPTDKGRIRPGG